MKKFFVSGSSGPEQQDVFSAQESVEIVHHSKFNWMVATSLTAISGFIVIAGALWLMHDSGRPQLATRQITPSTSIAASLPAPDKPVALNSNIESIKSSKTDKIAMLDLKRPESEKPALPAPATTTIAKTSSTVIAKNSLEEELPASDTMDAGKTLPSETALKKPETSEPRETAENTKSTGPEEIIISIEKGDTIFGVLTRSGIDKTEAYEISRRLTKVFPVSALRQGHALRMTMAAPGENGALRPERLVLDAGEKQVELRLTDNGAYKIAPKNSSTASKAPKAEPPKKNEEFKTASTGTYQRTRSRIQSSFYASAVSQNIPRRIVNKMSTVLSYGVDFQREISRGDIFEVFYANDGKDEGVLYSELNARGKKHAYYRFKSADGETDYYDVKGRSARKSLMRTPVNGARITSGFGRRRHPILRYNKMHSGIDFGAPRGTPIYAAADGRVVKAGWAGGYGKYVRLRHTRKMETAYAHMSRISRGIRPGKKVRQGQIIGYVGSTGRSTGPHLHYEIRLSGRAVNPLRYKGHGKTRKLAGRQLAAFKKEIRRINGLRKKTAISTYVADAGN